MASLVPELDDANLAVYCLDLQDRAPGAAGTLPNDDEWIAPLLQENAVWFCRLRWIAVAVLAAAGLASFFPHRLGSARIDQRPRLAALGGTGPGQLERGLHRPHFQRGTRRTVCPCVRCSGRKL